MWLKPAHAAKLVGLSASGLKSLRASGRLPEGAAKVSPTGRWSYLASKMVEIAEGRGSEAVTLTVSGRGRFSNSWVVEVESEEEGASDEAEAEDGFTMESLLSRIRNLAAGGTLVEIRIKDWQHATLRDKRTAKHLFSGAGALLYVDETGETR